jgi:hypothetical protein
MRRARPRAALAAGGARAPLPPGETPGHSYQHPQVGAWAVSSVPFQPPCAGGDRRCWAASSLRRWPLIITHFGGPTRQAKDGSNIVGRVEASVTVDATAIPWLPLSAASTSLAGPDGDPLVDTTYIERTATPAWPRGYSKAAK